MLLGCALQVRIYITEGEIASGESGAERSSWAHYASDSPRTTAGSQTQKKGRGKAAHALFACYLWTEWISESRVAESPPQTASSGSGCRRALTANMNQTATVSQVKCQSSKTIKVGLVYLLFIIGHDWSRADFSNVAPVFRWWGDEVWRLAAPKLEDDDDVNGDDDDWSDDG